jgi:hypothetical protein
MMDYFQESFEGQIAEFNGVISGGCINNDYTGDQLWLEAQNGGADNV